MHQDAKQYPRLEEQLNVLTHGLGLLLSIAALVILVLEFISHLLIQKGTTSDQIYLINVYIFLYLENEKTLTNIFFVRCF
jgi:predicted membrane channel-forming protein YqfA (hemolysin III family)|tara:strand:+ start:5293 stop:5532 length:240 start_codon:yes stop_codon:yes gene_type:complete